MAGGGCQAAEVEMERLCKVMGRLETIKLRLLRLHKDNARNSDKSHLFQQTVIYVPMVELREKL